MKTLNLRALAALASLTIGTFAASTSARAEEFTVGLQMPMTGAMARSGTAFTEGIQTAAEIFNKSNGKHKIKLVTVDDESNPAKAVSAVEKLASDGAVAIVGGFGSNLIGPASEAAAKQNLVYVTAGGVDDGLSRRGLKTFFRINNTAGYEKAVLALADELKVKSISIVYSTKEATTDLAHNLNKALSAKGVKVTEHAFDPAITDFKPIINKIKLRDKPEILFMSGYENDYIGILRAAKVLKPQVKAVVGVWSLATSKMWKDFPDLMPNVIGTSMLPFPVAYTSAEGKAFAETYQKKYNKEVDYLSQFGFVKAQILFEAIARAADAGTLKKGGIADEVRKTNRDTLIGRVTFDANGDNLNFTHRMGQHQNGKVVIVSPKAQATGNIVYPGVPW
ncbi:amino acid ABC transporter substrate-binding protein [Aquabacterium soli]|uniref:Amino acid ABC transporter substrate-binding protein n=1 Tax=Aquabacterium soli TaxID=2493092 RepID=A0A426VFX5_9BURK|nr:ABC transporter substrate-binding protein [Aquabacterium soli]RRS05620.1 amino acid ABC transporter substrate-binding protein [Aquabacterium soli]